MCTDAMVNINICLCIYNQPAWDLMEHRHIGFNVITCEQAIPLTSEIPSVTGKVKTKDACERRERQTKAQRHRRI